MGGNRHWLQGPYSWAHWDTQGYGEAPGGNLLLFILFLYANTPLHWLISFYSVDEDWLKHIGSFYYLSDHSKSDYLWLRLTIAPNLWTIHWRHSEIHWHKNGKYNNPWFRTMSAISISEFPSLRSDPPFSSWCSFPHRWLLRRDESQDRPALSGRNCRKLFRLLLLFVFLFPKILRTVPTPAAYTTCSIFSRLLRLRTFRSEKSSCTISSMKSSPSALRSLLLMTEWVHFDLWSLIFNVMIMATAGQGLARSQPRLRSVPRMVSGSADTQRREIIRTRESLSKIGHLLQGP